MLSERQMRLNLLEALRDRYHLALADGETQLANSLVREMIPHCNRLLLLVVEYLSSRPAGPPVPAAALPQAVPAPLPLAEAPTYTCEECGRQFAEAARYYGHLSSHKRQKKKTAPAQ